MKNPFLIFYTSLFFVLLASLLHFQNLGIWSFLIFLSYIFYSASLWQSLLVVGVGVLILGAWTSVSQEFTLFVLIFYAAMLVFRRKVLRPTIYAKAFYSFICIALFFVYLQRATLGSLKSYVNDFYFLSHLLLCFIWTLGIWYFLEEIGRVIEEKFFTSHQDAQLSLFTLRQLKQMDSSSPFKFQKRIRRRFGLKDW